MKHLLLALLLLSQTARAQGLGPAPRGARAVAFGGAATALGGDPWSAANNAAGLANATQPAVGFYLENRYLIPALNVAAVALALPVGAIEPAAGGQPARASRGVAGFEAQRFGGQLYNETRVGAAYGYRLGAIGVGARLDALQISLQDLGSRRVLAASLGGQVAVLPGERLTLGAYLYNLGQARLADYQDERVPTVLRAGAAYRPGAQVLLVLETEKDVERDAAVKAGLEYQPTAAVALRAGYNSAQAQTTGGAGVQAGGFRFDYAAGWQAELGLSHYLSVQWAWARK